MFFGVIARMQPLGNVFLRNVLCAVCFTFVFGCRLWKKAWLFAARSGNLHFAWACFQIHPSLWLWWCQFFGVVFGCCLRVCSRLAVCLCEMIFALFSASSIFVSSLAVPVHVFWRYCAYATTWQCVFAKCSLRCLLHLRFRVSSLEKGLALCSAHHRSESLCKKH